MANFLISFANSALLDNLALVQLLGVSAFLAASARYRSSIEFAQLAGLLLVGACTINLWLFHFILVPLGLQILQLPLFAICGSTLSALMLRFMAQKMAVSARRQQFNLILFGSSSAVVGNSLLLAQLPISNASTWANLLGAAFGFALLLLMFAAIRERLDSMSMPKAFQGTPSYLLGMGLVSLCLMALGGN